MEKENSTSMNNVAATNWQIQDGKSTNSICDPRKSMAWDSAFFTSPGVLDPEELFSNLGFTEKQTSPQDSSEIDSRSSIGGSNARRSLAWDSAFFTSAGVLDQEELSLVNRGFRRCEPYHLPAINEVTRSADLNSEIDPDGFSLSSLEIDLFGDLRASLNQESNVSEGSIPSSRLRRTAPKLSCTSCQMKPMQPPRRRGIRTHGSEISKETPPLPPRGQAKLGTQIGESKMLKSLRSPKAVGGTTSPLTASTGHRPYLSANHLKMDTKPKKDSAGMSKKPCLEDSPAVIPKSGSTVSPTATKNNAVFTSPSDNSNDEAQSSSLRRKISSRHVVSNSNCRTPSSSARNRSGLGSSSHLNQVFFTPKSFFSTSRATSHDRWSAESASTSTSAKRKSVDSPARVDAIPCGLLPFNDDYSQLSDSAYHRQGTRSQYSSTEILPNAKPSYLRKPTPKIGFFDEEQCTVLEFKGHHKFHPSIGSSITENGTGNLNHKCSRTKFGKHQLSGSSVGVSCPSSIRRVHGSSDNAFRASCRRDYLKTHGLVATCDVERKGTLVSRKKTRIARESEGQVCLSSGKRYSRESEEAHDSDKENVVPFENQVEDLSRHIQSIDLSKDLGTK